MRDNLALGGFPARRRRGETDKRLREVFELFPILEERAEAQARTLSGGEAQQLAIGRALMSGPRLVLLDEPSLGLAPRMIERVFSALRELSRRGVAILLAEQNALEALALAHRGYVLERGHVKLAGDAADLRANPDVVSSYLGEAAAV